MKEIKMLEMKKATHNWLLVDQILEISSITITIIIYLHYNFCFLSLKQNPFESLLYCYKLPHICHVVVVIIMIIVIIIINCSILLPNTFLIIISMYLTREGRKNRLNLALVETLKFFLTRQSI